MTIRVKICGVTRPDDARAAVRFGADMIGVNFYEKSSRAISTDRAKTIRDAIGSDAKLVGVFVNSERDYILQRIDAARLDLIQFHGDEPDEMLSGWAIPVIRAVRLRENESFDIAQCRAADFVLLDSFQPGVYGGTGIKRSLAAIRGLDLSRAIISGGLDPANVAEAASLAPYAVDCASGVESAPGIKDHDKMRSFIANARSAR